MRSLKYIFAIFLINVLSLPVFAHDENTMKQQLSSCPITEVWIKYKEADSTELQNDYLTEFEKLLTQYKIITPITQLQNQQEQIYTSLIQTSAELKNALNSNSKQELELKIDALLFKHLEFEITVSDIKSSQVWKMTYVLLIILLVFILTIIFLIYIYNSAKHRAQKEKLFTNQMIQVQEEERARISRELHDTITQDLRTSLLFLRELSEKFTDQTADEYQLVAKINTLQTQNLKSIRNIIQNLTPAEIETANLKNLLTDYCGRVMQISGLNCTFYAEENLDFTKFSSIQKLNIFRIIQEAITNSIKHADATEINILVRKDRENPKKMIFFVCDNGHGFDTAGTAEQTSEFSDQSSILTSGTHLGLNGMKKRAQILNAELKITSDEECGTEIRLMV